MIKPTSCKSKEHISHCAKGSRGTLLTLWQLNLLTLLKGASNKSTIINVDLSETLSHAIPFIYDIFPNEFKIHQNFPNPFNQITKFPIEIILEATMDQYNTTFFRCEVTGVQQKPHFRAFQIHSFPTNICLSRLKKFEGVCALREVGEK